MGSDFLRQFEGLKIEHHGVRLPSFVIEEDYKKQFKIQDGTSNFEFLKTLCRTGFKKLGLKRGTAEHAKYSNRIQHELAILSELGFVDYILLVWDVINFCKQNDIPVGLGRGSAAGSLVLYLIEVTRIDPIKYGLYFERFVSKIRAKKKEVDGITYLDGSLMCDIDVDVCYYNRHKVLKYLEDKFKGKTCKISTFNTLTAKLLIKECGKIVGEKSETEMNDVSGMIPKIHGKVKDIEKAIEEVDEFREWCEKNEEVYDTALKLRGLIKNKSVHPSAISLSYGEMEEVCPTELSSDKAEISAYDMDWISEFNVKLDILGLRSVSVVDDACRLIGIKDVDIDLDDPIIYQQLQDLRTPHGIFQIESDTNYRVCQDVKPRNLEELSAVLALARPGALAWVEDYAKYTNHNQSEPVHDFFREILAETGGVALYQEQLMKMANKIGFTLDESEILRRIVGKKKEKEVKQWEGKIEKKITEQGLEKEIGEVLWKILNDSASYSFNKSHSVCYAALSASTIYLKFKYPQQFFLSLLRMTRHEPDPISEISKIEKELKRFDIKLLPPHLIKSKMDFSIDGKDIRFGLLSIKGIAEKAMEKLDSFRDEYANKFQAFEAAKEAGLNIGVLCALIQAGALEGFKQSRSKVVYEAQLWNTLTKKEKTLCLELGDEHDYNLVRIVKTLTTTTNEKGKELLKPSRFETIKNKCKKYKEIFEQNSKCEPLANWYYEKGLLGYNYGKKLVDIFIERNEDLITLDEVENEEIDSRVTFIGWIEGKVYTGRSRANQNKYHKMSVSDEFGSQKVMIFNDRADYCMQINGGRPKEGDIVIVKGTKKEGVIFAYLVAVQPNKVYTKLSDLTKELKKAAETEKEEKKD